LPDTAWPFTNNCVRGPPFTLVGPPELALPCPTYARFFPFGEYVGEYSVIDEFE
jgi:hypothetical protein